MQHLIVLMRWHKVWPVVSPVKGKCRRGLKPVRKGGPSGSRSAHETQCRLHSSSQVTASDSLWLWSERGGGDGSSGSSRPSPRRRRRRRRARGSNAALVRGRVRALQLGATARVVEATRVADAAVPPTDTQSALACVVQCNGYE